MPDSVGNSFNTALGISLGPAPRLFADSIEFDDNDYYRFTLSSRSTLAVSLSGLVNNADVQVLSSAGTVVTDNDGFVLSSTNDGTLLEAFTALLDAGTYLVELTTFGYSLDHPLVLQQRLPLPIGCQLQQMTMFGQTSCGAMEQPEPLKFGG